MYSIEMNGRRSLRRCRTRGTHSGVRSAGPDALPVEAREQSRIARSGLRQKLQRDGLLQLQIGSAIYLAHATAPDQIDNPVTLGKHRPGRKAAVGKLADSGLEIGPALSSLPDMGPASATFAASATRPWIAPMESPSNRSSDSTSARISSGTRCWT